MGNNRIRKAGFLNQNFLCATNPRKTFFAPVPKIFLQQYRPKADIGEQSSDPDPTPEQLLLGC
jgi:hypothetical protein